MFDDRCLLIDVRCLVTDNPMFDDRCSMFDDRCLVIDVWGVMSDVDVENEITAGKSQKDIRVGNKLYLPNMYAPQMRVPF